MGLNETQKIKRSKYLEKHLEVTECSQRKNYIFVSYASDDWEVVFKSAIVPMQKQYGLRVYADKAFDKVNDKWIVPMLRNVRAADMIVAFVSQSYIESYPCFLELLTAVNNHKKIVFVSLGDQLHLGNTTDLPVIDRGVKKEILNQGANIFTNTNNTSNDVMRAMKSAYTNLSTLLEQDALSKYDISDAFINFFRDASINRKTINDLPAVQRTIHSVSPDVFSKTQTGETIITPAPEADFSFQEQEQKQEQSAKRPSNVRLIGGISAAAALIILLLLFSSAKNLTNTNDIAGSTDNVYEGELQNGERNGQGTMIFTNGSVYEGEWKDGKQNGQGVLTFANGDVYKGEFQDGKRNGQGTYTSADGSSTYVGTWANDQRNGQGTMTHANGDVYKGEWKDNHRNGQGTMTYASDNVYVGEWKNHNRDGQGTMTFANGDVYTGEWENDKQNGEGTYTFLSGSVYVGEWKDGKWNGQGTYTDTNGNVYTGEWKDDKRNGQGTYTDTDGNVYTGEWKDHHLNGLGTITYANGDVYEGEFVEDKKNGDAVYTKADGTVVNETWDHGTKIE